MGVEKVATAAGQTKVTANGDLAMTLAITMARVVMGGMITITRVVMVMTTTIIMVKAGGDKAMVVVMDMDLAMVAMITVAGTARTNNKGRATTRKGAAMGGNRGPRQTTRHPNHHRHHHHQQQQQQDITHINDRHLEH